MRVAKIKATEENKKRIDRFCFGWLQSRGYYSYRHPSHAYTEATKSVPPIDERQVCNENV